MPIEIEDVSDKRLLRATARGNISLHDVLAHLEREQAANALGIPELIDARDATTDMRGRQVRELVSHLRKLSHRYPLGPTAFVATDDVVYGMARMYSILCADFDPRFAVFRDTASADAWLQSGSPVQE